jgi:ribosomal 50S subunit-associated protein YjgA (DUF615 family)
MNNGMAAMDQGVREELEKKLEQTRRLAAAAGDQTTVQRLREFADELRYKLQQLVSRARGESRQEDAIRSRARELWKQQGRPTGRDEEFWLQAEREILQAVDKPGDTS